jgi:hypothetical protein
MAGAGIFLFAFLSRQTKAYLASYPKYNGGKGVGS